MQVKCCWFFKPIFFLSKNLMLRRATWCISTAAAAWCLISWIQINRSRQIDCFSTVGAVAIMFAFLPLAHSHYKCCRNILWCLRWCFDKAYYVKFLTPSQYFLGRHLAFGWWHIILESIRRKWHNLIRNHFISHKR